MGVLGGCAVLSRPNLLPNAERGGVKSEVLHPGLLRLCLFVFCYLWQPICFFVIA